MGSRGPIRKLHVVSPTDAPTPIAELGVRDCPKDLPIRAQYVWKMVVHLMKSRPGWLSEDNLFVLKRYARTVALYEQVEEELSEKGLVYEKILTQIDTQGMPVDRRSWARRPETTLAKEFRDSMRRDEAILGLGNALRGRLPPTGSAVVEADDPA